MNSTKVVPYRNQARTVGQFVKSATGKATAVVAGTVGAAGSALASSDPGAAILAEINTAATTVGGILVVLAGIVGMFVLWSYLKRAK